MAYLTNKCDSFSERNELQHYVQLMIPNEDVTLSVTVNKSVTVNRCREVSPDNFGLGLHETS